MNKRKKYAPDQRLETLTQEELHSLVAELPGGDIVGAVLVVAMRDSDGNQTTRYVEKGSWHASLGAMVHALRLMLFGG